jgi:hypothetical protein
VIRNAVLHINNEQPLVADLFELPSADDQLLRCTNLRTLDGKRPVFADDSASVFYFPYRHLRFVEILPSSLGGEDLPVPVEARPARSDGPDGQEELDVELEIDEDLLRRVREV